MRIALADGRRKLSQWDTGRRLTVSDAEDVTKIRLSRQGEKKSHSVALPGNGLVDIPDWMLWTGGTLVADAIQTDETGDSRVYSVSIPIQMCAKPEE